MNLPGKLLILSVLAGFYVACSPVNFETDVDCGTGCLRVNGMKHIEYNISVSGGKVDILFVDDNSASMSTEQNGLANRFSSFISALDAKALDYRIGVITTDIANSTNPARSINRNGALQDGRLIEFSNGASFIEPGTANKEALFRNVIERQETKDCESYLNSLSSNATVPAATYQAKCPSPDERGIYAASMTVDANPAGFIRNNAHLAIVFLSDEDVRSQLYKDSPYYQLDSRDLPQNLVARVQGTFSGKALSMHSIIVRPGEIKNGYSASDVADRISKVIGAYGAVDKSNSPENFFLSSQHDSACLNIQNNQTNQVSGTYGYLYFLAARLTGGVVGNVCASDYGSQLSAIGLNIGEQLNRIDLACENPKILELRFANRAGTPGGEVQGSAYLFDPAITPGNTIYLKIECPDM